MRGGALCGVVIAAGLWRLLRRLQEVSEALADVFVPALGAIQAALTGGVVEMEEQEEPTEFTVKVHGSPASIVAVGGVKRQ